MGGCSVAGCDSNTRHAQKVRGLKTKFFRFPQQEQNQNLSQEWIAACHAEKPINIKTARICSKHFSKKQKIRNLRNILLKHSPVRQQKLVQNAVPDLYLPNRLQGESQQNNNIIDYSPTKRTPFKTVIGRNAVCNEGLNELLMDNNPDHERSHAESQNDNHNNIDIEDLPKKRTTINQILQKSAPCEEKSTLSFDDTPEHERSYGTLSNLSTSATSLLSPLELLAEVSLSNLSTSATSLLSPLELLAEVSVAKIICDSDSNTSPTCCMLQRKEMLSPPSAGTIYSSSSIKTYVRPTTSLFRPVKKLAASTSVPSTRLFVPQVSTCTTRVPLTLPHEAAFRIAKNQSEPSRRNTKEGKQQNKPCSTTPCTTPSGFGFLEQTPPQLSLENFLTPHSENNFPLSSTPQPLISPIEQAPTTPTTGRYQSVPNGSWNNVKSFIQSSENVSRHIKAETMKDIITGLYERNAKLEYELRSKRIEIKSLKDALQKSQAKKCCKDILSKYFSSGMVRKITSGNAKKRIVWSADDIAAAISLRAVSAQAYRYLIKVMGLPLPSFTTLKRWAQKINLRPGILQPIMALITKKAKTWKPREKIAVISYDEMEISKMVCVDKKNQEVFGPHSKAQCVMVRGLFGKWKQLIYYNFDKAMTKTIVYDLIRKLSDAEINVVACVSDQGGENRGVANGVEVDIHKPYFQPFSDPIRKNRKVFFFYDAPHLLKSIRNHFIDEGYALDGKSVSKRSLVKILEVEKAGKLNDLSVAFKVRPEYLKLSNIQRQNVKKAAKLLSHTNAMAVKFLAEQKVIDDPSWKEVSYFLELMNNWFDLLNSVAPWESYQATPEQDALLDEVNAVMSRIRNLKPNIDNGSAMLPCQKGIIQSNNALKGLFKYLKEEVLSTDPKFNYIITRRLNQDIIENFFSHMRRMGAYNTHPDPLDFMSRIRWYILGRDSQLVNDAALNTKLDTLNEERLANLKELVGKKHQNKTEAEKITLTEELFNDIIDCQPLSKKLLNPLVKNVDKNELKVADDFIDLENDPNLEGKLEPEYKVSVSYNGGREYIAGYVAYRVRKEFPGLGDYTCKLSGSKKKKSWTECVSKGYLLEPSDELKRVIRIADEEFVKFHGPNELKKEGQIFNKLLTIIKKRLGKPQTVDDKVLLLFIRTRTFLRLRSWNRSLRQVHAMNPESSEGRSRKKKLEKFKK